MQSFAQSNKVSDDRIEVTVTLGGKLTNDAQVDICLITPIVKASEMSFRRVLETRNDWTTEELVYLHRDCIRHATETYLKYLKEYSVVMNVKKK
jgi:hypothetical protein